jgi:hypothetical protein
MFVLRNVTFLNVPYYNVSEKNHSEDFSLNKLVLPCYTNQKRIESYEQLHTQESEEIDQL